MGKTKGSGRGWFNVKEAFTARLEDDFVGNCPKSVRKSLHSPSIAWRIRKDWVFPPFN